MGSAIEISIDTSGRLVIPKIIRERAGLRPGMSLEITYRQGVIEIAPEPRKVRIVEDCGLFIAFPDKESEPLRESAVQEVVHDFRTGRD